MTADPVFDALMVVNHYRLLAGPAAFSAATASLAARVECDGHPGVLDYRFFVQGMADEGRAVVRYANPAAWIGHHDIAMGWPEMAALRAVADLTAFHVHGAVSADMVRWMDQAGLAARLRDWGPAVAGFSRNAG